MPFWPIDSSFDSFEAAWGQMFFVCPRLLIEKDRALRMVSTSFSRRDTSTVIQHDLTGSPRLLMVSLSAIRCVISIENRYIPACLMRWFELIKPSNRFIARCFLGWFSCATSVNPRPDGIVVLGNPLRFSSIGVEKRDAFPETLSPSHLRSGH